MEGKEKRQTKAGVISEGRITRGSLLRAYINGETQPSSSSLSTEDPSLSSYLGGSGYF